jgi:hypothetical protein
MERVQEAPLMFRFIAAVLALATCVCAAPSPDDSPRAVRIGVLDLTGENIPDAEIRLLSDRLRIELYRTGRFEVLERERMTDILAEHEFSLSGCVASECIIDVGQMLSVEQMVAGNVGRIGAVHTLSLRLVDVESGAISRIATKDCMCSLSQVLTRLTGEAADELAGAAPSVGRRQTFRRDQPSATATPVGDDGIDYSQFGQTKVGTTVTIMLLATLGLILLNASSGSN